MRHQWGIYKDYPNLQCGLRKGIPEGVNTYIETKAARLWTYGLKEYNIIPFELTQNDQKIVKDLHNVCRKKLNFSNLIIKLFNLFSSKIFKSQFQGFSLKTKLMQIVAYSIRTDNKCSFTLSKQPIIDYFCPI